MKLFDIYVKDILLENVFELLENDIEDDEKMDSSLSKLLEKAKTLIFDEFGIDPSKKEYFIAGSARLYLSQELRDTFNLTNPLGDLDIVIPNKKLWNNLTSKKINELKRLTKYKKSLKTENKDLDTAIFNLTNIIENLKKGIYRPTNDGSIEAFLVWNPAIAGKQYEGMTFRSSDVILQDSRYKMGYHFMPIRDVVEYKFKLNREKEQDVVKLVNQYRQSSPQEKKVIVKKIIGLFGKEEARKLLSLDFDKP
jgi:hypothetical protein